MKMSIYESIRSSLLLLLDLGFVGVRTQPEKDLNVVEKDL